MLYLYDKNTISFLNNGEPIRHAYEAHVIRDEGFYLTFKLLLDKDEQYKTVKKEMIISAMTPDGRNQFRVYDVIKSSGYVEVTAVQLMYDFDNKEVNSFSLRDASGATVINAFRGAFKSNLGQFTLSSGVTETHDFTTDSDGVGGDGYNALEILNRITRRWDSELLVNGFDVRMVKRLGLRTNALLYEKKNISEFADESTVRGLVTRVHAVSRFNLEGAEDETVIKVTVDSPLVNQYSQVYERTYENNNAKTQAELTSWANLKFITEHVDKPKRSINVATNIIDGTEINYGDELVLKYLVHDVDEIIRCVGYDFDPMTDDYYGITLGDWRDNIYSAISGTVSQSTSSQWGNIGRQMNHVLTSANGKNRTAYGSNPVPNPIDGDIWYYYTTDRPNEVELRIFQDGIWVTIDFAMKQEVENALAEAEQAKQDAIKAYEDSIAEAERLVEEQNVVWQGKMDVYDSQVSQIETDVQSAQDKADQALIDVGISTDLAQTAKDLVDTVKIDVQTAKDDASQAIIDAGNALSQAQELDGQVSDLSLTVDDLNAEVDLRLTRTEVNSLVDGKGLATATYVNNQITATAESFGVELTKVEGKIDGLQVGGTNLIVQKTITRGSYLNVNGYAINSEDWFYTDYIPVAGYTKMVTSGYRGLGEFPATVYYDSSKNYVRGIHNNNENRAKDITINSGEAFIRFSGLISDLPTLKLEKGTIATDWSPAPQDTMMENDFTVFKNTYESTVDLINTELSKTAKTADLNGMVTESVLSTKNFVTAGTMTSTLANYAQTANVPTNTQFNMLKNSYDSMTQTIGTNGEKIAQMVMTDSIYQTTVANLDISSRVATGQQIASDPMFEKGANGLTVYNLASNTNVVLARTNYAGGTQPTGKSTRMQVTVNGAGSPGFGGVFRTGLQSRANAEFVVKFTANLPIGRQFNYNQNPMGTGYTHKWLTSNQGTGTWAEYAYYYKCGNTGTFNTFGYLFVSGGATPTVSSPLNWFIAKYEVYDISGTIQTQITQLADSWALTLKSGDDIKTQINATPNSIRLKADLIHLSGTSLIDNATIKSAHIHDLNANKITGNEADFTSLRAKVITADSISADRLVVGYSLVDRVFANQATVDHLWSQNIWANKITAIKIDASQINTGTLNAANVTIINLDVNSLTGNKTNFVQTAWNGISTAVKINSTGIDLLYANGTVSTKLNAGGLLFYEGGFQVALLQGMSESGNAYGYALAARTNYRVSLAYQATSSSYKSAISVRSTGAIQIGHDSASPSDVTWLTTNRILLNGSSTHAVKYTTISVFGEVCVFICNAAGNAGVAFGASELYLIRNNQATQFSSMLG